MEPSGACVSLIKRCEECRLTAYRDPGGVLTIGWGHTGGDVNEGMTITQTWADTLFASDLRKAARAVLALTEGVHLTQGRFDGLVSFVYNLGAGALGQSTLLKKLKDGDNAGAADEFLRWTFGRKGVQEVELRALLERRRAERRMFLGGAA